MYLSLSGEQVSILRKWAAQANDNSLLEALQEVYPVRNDILFVWQCLQDNFPDFPPVSLEIIQQVEQNMEKYDYSHYNEFIEHHLLEALNYSLSSC